MIARFYRVARPLRLAGYTFAIGTSHPAAVFAEALGALVAEGAVVPVYSNADRELRRQLAAARSTSPSAASASSTATSSPAPSAEPAAGSPGAYAPAAKGTGTT